MDLPSSDQASFEGTALILIVGNNTERGAGGELVLSDQEFLFFIIIFIYATSERGTSMYTQPSLRKPTFM